MMLGVRLVHTLNLSWDNEKLKTIYMPVFRRTNNDPSVLWKTVKPTERTAWICVYSYVGLLNEKYKWQHMYHVISFFVNIVYVHILYASPISQSMHTTTIVNSFTLVLGENVELPCFLASKVKR